MKPEQEAQGLSLSKLREQLEQLKPAEIDDFAELKKRGLDLRKLWRMLQRNLMLVGSITGVVAVVTLYLTLTSSRNYQGDFRLLVEPISSEAKLTEPSALLRSGENNNNNTNIDIDYPSLLQILQSTGLLERVVEKVQLKYPDMTYEKLTKNLEVQRIGKNMLDVTKVIEVRYKDEDPKKVEFVLGELAKEYLRYSFEDRKNRINSGVNFIDAQLPKLQQQVNTLEGNLQTIQQRYRLSDPDSQVEELSKQVREIEAQKLNSIRELQEQSRLYKSLEEQLGLTPNQAIAASTLSQEPRYQELLGQLKKTESQIAVESVRFKDQSPMLQKLKEQQQNLSVLLNQEAERILGQRIPIQVANSQSLNFQDSTRLALIKQLVDAANNVQVLESRLQAISMSEAFLDQQVRQFPASMRYYNEVRRQLEIATKTLNQLLVQRETLQVDAAQKEVPWEIVSPPRVPRDAQGNPLEAKSDQQKILGMGVLAALVLGLGAAAIKERFRNIFYTAKDIQSETDLPILEVIPWHKSVEQFPSSTEVVGSIEGVEAKDAKFLTAFDSLYASIRFLGGATPVQSLVVTSAATGEGKSTVALHLAQAAAFMGKKVLVVDANLRLPYLHTMLGLKNGQGLSNLLSQDLSPKASLIQRSPVQENLFVLTSGKLLPYSTSMLGSTQMQHLMEQFETAFDLVIYDSPDLLGSADTYFLAEHSDGILMVMGVGKTKRSLIKQALNRLQMLRLPVLGIVANYVEASKNSLSNCHHLEYETNQQLLPAIGSNQSKL